MVEWRTGHIMGRDNRMQYIQLLRNKINPYPWLLLALCALAFVLRAYNLNYNSAFNDEASDIIIGRLGIFQGDWWVYNASAWLAGFPYIYPPMTAIASIAGGVWGSRLLNVIIGTLLVETVYIFTIMTSRLKHPYDYLAGIIAAAIIGGSAIGLYVSRLATYDAPSFYLLFLALIPLVKAESPGKHIGRYYFYAAILAVLACLTKIIIFIYLPLLVLYSAFKAYSAGKSHLKLWFIYFFIPMIILSGMYILANVQSLITYAHVNTTRDVVSLSEFMTTLWENTSYVWIFWTIGTIGLAITKRWKLWSIFTLAALWMTVPHLLSQRALWTFEKQILLTIMFLAPICGIGIASLIKGVKFRIIRVALVTIFFFALGLYSTFSYNDAQRFNTKWANSTTILHYLASQVHNGDKVLAESGGTAILELYEKDYPTNVTTFDWFNYQGLEGKPAYISAVRDGYFDYIELEGPGQQGDQTVHQLRQELVPAMEENYSVKFINNGFYIYERKK